jgi:putative transposase
MAERVIQTIQEQCVHRQGCDSIRHATRVISDWIIFYNHRRPHQALDMKTPAEAFELTAQHVQIPLG